ncbi:MAG: cysteine desulfurase family protein [Proteobacteria bacterium]|nr:cysteine desulfurase family protein [Pseudomonadota bacterium]
MTTETFSYLDYNATTPVRPEVVSAMIEALGVVGNPSSVHRAGRAVRGAIEQARLKIATAIGASPEAIVFTSGGSEANTTAITRSGATRLLVSSIEHESILQSAASSGLAVDVFPVNGDGVADLEALTSALGQDANGTLVALMLANNETGAVQPVVQATTLAHAAGARLHCDAVQAFGKLPVDLAVLGADTLSISAHKLGGPKGVGALVLRNGVSIDALVKGGGQERNRRAGTENVVGIIGFGVAAEVANRSLSDAQSLASLRDSWEERVMAHASDAIIVSHNAQRLANTSCIAIPGVPSDKQLMALDLAGVCVSAGSACSSGKVTSSSVLNAMGYDDEVAGSAIRVSLGWETTAGDMDRLFDAWADFLSRFRQRKAS